MNVTSIILFAVFGVYSIVHLVFCFLENEKLRKITKPFCLIILGIAALVAKPDCPLIYAGAFLGAIGDIFLINKKNLLFFLSGTVFFISGHICYFAEIMMLLTSLGGMTIEYWFYLILFGILLLLTFGLYPIDKKLAGVATLAGNFYMPFLVVLLISGIVLAVNVNPSWAGISVAAGYLMFFASDTTLIYTTFVKDVRRRDFYIMLTYLLGEFGIVFGLLSAIIFSI